MTNNYLIKYDRRKTMGLYITKTAEIEVRAPLGTPEKVIHDFVKQHEDWIAQHHHQVRERVEKQQSFELNFRDQLIFLGKTYPLVPVAQRQIGFDGQRFYAYEQADPEELKSGLVKIYRGLAKQVLDSQVAELGTHMGLYPQAVKINGARTRWGSCSGRGNLNFSWYLVMAEEATIRYVVVHELAHLVEMNHSPNFWRIVEQVLPDYRREKEKLKKLQQLLSVQNWE